MPELQLLGPELTDALRRAERTTAAWLRRVRNSARPLDVFEEAVELRSTCGYRIAARVWRPRTGDGPWPALVWLGDHASGVAAASDADAPMTAPEAARMGWVVMALDLAGRGESTGEDDFGGAEHADNVTCAVHHLLDRPDVDGARVGILGLGLGAPIGIAAAASGAPVSFVLDWEGPVDRETLLSVHPDASLGVDDAVWWADRDTLGQIGRLACGYIRLQSEDDHRNPEELRHAQRALFAAQWRSAPAPGFWYQINHHPRGEAPARPQWLPPGRFAAGRAIQRKLVRLATDRRLGAAT